MTMMAIRSSIIASAIRKIFSEAGTLRPSMAHKPSAKAMSVAAGMAQPRKAWASPQFTAAKIAAGMTKPPNAAITGNAACLALDSGPSIASRLISSPTSRKNTAIKPSLIQ